MNLADKLLIVSILSLVVLLTPNQVFAKSSNGNSGSHGQSGSSHGNSAFGHSHQSNSITSTSSTIDNENSVSSGGGGRDFIFPCVVDFEYGNYYKHDFSYENYVEYKTKMILNYYENYKKTGDYCGVPILQFGDLN